MDYYSKSMSIRDSPPSVLMDRYGTDTPPLRGMNSLIEPYQPQTNKAASIHASPSPPTMVQKQRSVDELSHGSVVESPTASADRQSSQGQAEKSKSVSFEDEEEVKPERRKMTVRERWHWAYNKIVMQLNVSTLQTYDIIGFSVVRVFWSANRRRHANNHMRFVPNLKEMSSPLLTVNDSSYQHDITIILIL
jgi:hypothetical protein